MTTKTIPAPNKYVTSRATAKVDTLLSAVRRHTRAGRDDEARSCCAAIVDLVEGLEAGVLANKRDAWEHNRQGKAAFLAGVECAIGAANALTPEAQMAARAYVVQKEQGR